MSEPVTEVLAGAMTLDEHEAIRLAGDLYQLLLCIVGDDFTREGDLAELIAPIHLIQRSIMGQAAARMYPDKYRLLGQTVTPP